MNPETIRSNLASIAAEFASRRSERQTRRSLDRADFERLRSAGFLELAIPDSMGGCWAGVRESAPAICESLRVLAAGDSSVALVCAMHPAMLSLWLATTSTEDACSSAWEQQRNAVFETARQGAFWGTVTSEAGTGGDLNLTRSTAKPAPDGYRLSGSKHFATGLGVASFMVTTAVPDGEDGPDLFFLDARNIVSGCPGASVTSLWEGHGMLATQSHSVRFDEHPATRFALPGRMGQIVSATGGLFGCLFSSVIVGIVEAAMEVARRQIRALNNLGSYERVRWVDVEVEAWKLGCCYGDMLAALRDREDARRTALIGKLAVSELAESILLKLCRIFGGGTYSCGSPFGFWFEDVRALGFLRPPWALSYEMIFERLLPARG